MTDYEEVIRPDLARFCGVPSIDFDPLYNPADAWELLSAFWREGFSTEMLIRHQFSVPCRCLLIRVGFGRCSGSGDTPAEAVVKAAYKMIVHRESMTRTTKEGEK